MILEIFIYFVLFAIFGVAHEVFWTSIIDSFKDKNPRLKGRSSLWMFPIYGVILFIVLLVNWIYPVYPWWFRGFMYAILILTWEYLSGFMIKKFVGVAPWDYSTNDTYDGVGRKKRFHINGLICLEYFPIWFIGGLIAEWFFLFLQAHLIL